MFIRMVKSVNKNWTKFCGKKIEYLKLIDSFYKDSNIKVYNEVVDIMNRMEHFQIKVLNENHANNWNGKNDKSALLDHTEEEAKVEEKKEE